MGRTRATCTMTREPKLSGTDRSKGVLTEQGEWLTWRCPDDAGRPSTQVTHIYVH